jgi:hypothetical protein
VAYLIDRFQVRALTWIAAFLIGLISGMTLELPDLPESQIISREVENRRRLD